jgi:hypothetical protein
MSDVFEWFEESDDEDEACLWRSRAAAFDRDTPLPWFVLSARHFWLDRVSVELCFPWWRGIAPRELLAKAQKRLRDEAKLCAAFVALVRDSLDTDRVDADADDNDDDDDEAAITVRVDTFAHKLARLRHLNQAEMNALRAAPELDRSDDFCMLSRLPRLPMTPKSVALATVAATATARAAAVPLPAWLRAIVIPLLLSLDVVSLAHLAATCRALNSAATHDKLWRRHVQQRFGSAVKRASDAVSYRSLFCSLATFESRRRRRRETALASLAALAALPAPERVHAVAVCGLKRSMKRRALDLMLAARAPRAAVADGASAIHWPLDANGRVDVLDVGRLQLFRGARGNGSSIVPVSALVYVVDNFAPAFFTCRALVHLLHELARLRGVRLVLIYCMMWHSDPKCALEADRVAQELHTGALTKLRVEARLHAVDPSSGAGVAAGLEWLEQALRT